MKQKDPLIDDATAFRLAVDMSIGVQCHAQGGSGYVLAECGIGKNEPVVVLIQAGDDLYAATRRAISQSAAMKLGGKKP